MIGAILGGVAGLGNMIAGGLVQQKQTGKEPG